MLKKITALALVFALLLLTTACGERKSPLNGNGARKVILGLGNGDGDSRLYVDTDAPVISEEPTPTPPVEVTVTPEITPSVTPTGSISQGGNGSFSVGDCVLLVGDITIRPGMNYSGYEEKAGKIIDRMEGVACLSSGYDINYYYDNFSICTISKDDMQIVYNADFTGGDVTTSKGIRIGSTVHELIEAYGEPKEEDLFHCVYEAEKQRIAFYLTDEVITEIMLYDTSVN